MWKPRQWEVKCPWHVGRVGSQSTASTLPGLCGCTFSLGHRLWWCSSGHPPSASVLQLPCLESTSQKNHTLWSFGSHGAADEHQQGFHEQRRWMGRLAQEWWAGTLGVAHLQRVACARFGLELFIRNTKCLLSRSSQTSVAWKVAPLHSHSWQAGWCTLRPGLGWRWFIFLSPLFGINVW